MILFSPFPGDDKPETLYETETTGGSIRKSIRLVSIVSSREVAQ